MQNVNGLHSRFKNWIHSFKYVASKYLDNYLAWFLKRETPEQERERLYQEEQKKNPAGNFNDNLNRVQAGMPNTTETSVKEIGVLILIVLVIFIA